MPPRMQSNPQQEELKSMKSAMIRYILNSSSKKKPIKSADIVKKCMRGEQKMFQQLLPEVEEALNNVYGYKLNEFKEKSGKYYLVTSELGATSIAEYASQQRQELRLLFIVLSYIFMKGGKVTEPVLFGFLKKLQIEEEPHDYFGNFKQYINETFVQQMYLKKEKLELEGANTDDKFTFSWGNRADLEFKKIDCLNLVAEIMKKPATSFIKQYEACNADDENATMEED